MDGWVNLFLQEYNLQIHHTETTHPGRDIETQIGEWRYIPVVQKMHISNIQSSQLVTTNQLNNCQPLPMLEGLTLSLPHPCLLHRNQHITHLCTDPRCHNNPSLCHTCLTHSLHIKQHNNHQEHIIPLQQAIKPLAQKIEASKGVLESIFQKTLGTKENVGALKQIGSHERHCRDIEAMISTLRQQTEREFDQILLEVSRKISSQKQSILLSLDNNLRIYIQNIAAYSLIVEPILSFHSHYRHYSSLNAMELKLAAEARQNSSFWFREMKRVVSVTSRILEKPQEYFNTLAQATVYMREMMDEMPRVIGVGVEIKERRARMRQIVEETCRYVGVKEIRPLQMYLNENSPAGSGERKSLPRAPSREEAY